ncbi:MAG: hypothetical protein RL172_599 [Bacteroidota bacterium]|jgi:tetratricopeptide (TPR) repeat protein
MYLFVVKCSVKRAFVKRLVSWLLILLPAQYLYAQKMKADSIGALLQKELPDTMRIKLMWQMADAMGAYAPEQALLLAQQSLYSANSFKYYEGQSRSIGVMANVLIKMGNYPRALEYYIQKLQIDEKGNNPRNLASVLMNIGIVYIFQEEYPKSLEYYYRSDSVIKAAQLTDLVYYSALNLGDVYDRMNVSDSAFVYYNKALAESYRLQDMALTGTALTGLAHTYRKKQQYTQAQMHYSNAIAYLKAAGDDDIYCEATLGLARLYDTVSQHDSAAIYAKKSLQLAIKDGLQGRVLDAASFLATHYKDRKNADSAFVYINQLQAVNDSINSKTRIREAQILTSNEQLRQQEIAESKRIAAEERRQQLQLLFIAIFIPGFFMLSIFLSRINIPIKIIKVLGVISLLFLFEYLTLLLHPYVQAITHHTPVYEILIFVSIAAILIPAHHRIEHWFIHKLTSHRLKKDGKLFSIKTSRIRLKK